MSQQKGVFFVTSLVCDKIDIKKVYFYKIKFVIHRNNKKYVVVQHIKYERNCFIK